MKKGVSVGAEEQNKRKTSASLPRLMRLKTGRKAQIKKAARKKRAKKKKYVKCTS